MKKLFIFLLILGTPIIFFAQTVLVSEPLPLKNGEGYNIIGKLKGRYLLYQNTLEGRDEISGFDAQMNLKWTKELEFDHKRAKIIDLIASKNDFTFIYQYQAKGRAVLKAHKYDAAANLLDSVTILTHKSTYYETNLEIVQSKDKSKLLLYQIEDQSKVKAISFDLDSMKVLWTNMFLPAGLAFQRDFVQTLVTNKGQMYFILGKDNRKNKRDDHVYDIYYGNEESNEKGITFFTFPMDKKLTFDVVFTYDNLNKRIVAGGLYSEKTRTKSMGYFYFSISPENPDDYRLIFEPFDDEFVSTFLGKQVAASKGLNEAVVQEIILRRDGGILLVGEHAVQSERQNVGAGSLGSTVGHSYYDYYYDDLFVISIHPDGQTHWETILHKKQYSYDDGANYSSYLLLKTATSLRFVFNDEIKYENTVSEYVLRGDGEYDRNSILNTKNKKLRLLFRKGLQVASNEYIVPSEHRNKLSLVNIKY